ncbi:hypothetical protein SUGI_0433300 [Cryptomeria japonica]|nr:hypothetical protein SUGI_0433300 [Cryptomeria japonica]
MVALLDNGRSDSKKSSSYAMKVGMAQMLCSDAFVEQARIAEAAGAIVVVVVEETPILYEGELEGCTFDEDNDDMQGFGEIDSSSQESVVCNDGILNIVTPFFVDNAHKPENSMVCSNKEDMLQPMLMLCQFIQGDECEELVRVDMLETGNDILPIPLQVTLYAVDQIVPELSNHEDTCEPIDAIGKDEEKGQSSHDDFVKTYESYNTEYSDTEVVIA